MGRLQLGEQFDGRPDAVDVRRPGDERHGGGVGAGTGKQVRRVLAAGAREAGVQRFVAQSFASYRYARVGGPVKTEDDPLDPDGCPGRPARPR
jgi:hypothetical protein